MNPHIELVKKFLADDTSVTEEELKANKHAAYDAYWAAAEAAEAAYWAAEDAYWAAYWATDANIPENAEYYKQKAIEAIAEYEELTK